MHRVPLLFALGLAIAGHAPLAASQDQHGSHAAAFMGFDQEATAHHFYLFPMAAPST